jgi:NHLM bacteriocin system ABC transporter ATP-binding protein
LQEKILSIKNNELILLNHPKTIWLIQSGSVGVFAVEINNGTIVGNRRHLFTCHSQDVLLPTKPSLGQTYTQMLALALNNVELLKIDRECFEQLILNMDAVIEKGITNWLNKLSTLVEDAITQKVSFAITPTVTTNVAYEKPVKLVDGQTFQPQTNELIWITIDSGYGRWLGKEEFTITPVTGAIPLIHPMWLEADGDVQLSLLPNPRLDSVDMLLTGFDWLHKQLLYLNKCKLKKERDQELQRIRSKKKLDFQVTNTALQQLASALIPSAITIVKDEAPLLVAAGAVARALGTTINPPSQSEDLQRLKEPLEAIARSSHLRIRQVTLSDQWWQQDCGAMVAYTRSSHRPVALLQVTPTSYELLDPLAQTRIRVDAKVAATLKPVAYIFYRSLPERIYKKIELISFALFGLRKELLVILTTGIGVALLGMVTPYATGILIDNAIPDRNRSLLVQIGLGLLSAAPFTALFSLVQRFALLRVETTAEISTQAAIWDKLLKLPVFFFRQYNTGDLHSRVTSVKEINRLVTGITTTKLLGGSFALLNLLLLWYYSFRLTIVAVILALIVTIFTAVSGTILIRTIQPLLEIRGNLFGQTVQLINGIAKLKVAGAESRAFAAWSKYYSEQIKLELSTQYIEDLVALVNTILPTITTGILFAAAVTLFNQEQNTGQAGLTLGTFIAFNAAFNTFVSGATNLSSVIIDISRIIPLWKRTKPILETLPEVESNQADPGRLIGRININRISFRYQQDKPLILEDIRINIEPGKFIALVGSSGSGKSTLLRLLIGFETPETGSIYYDGQDLASLDATAVRRQMGVVLQSGKITSGSILENLTSGTQTTIDEAWSALSLADFAREVREMPMGLQTLISEGGGNLSGGQRQRLLIAKALILKPRILLFDEATSALDNKTQSVVSENLDKLKVTRVVIAHRLSTIRNADRIYVLEAGKIVQQGNFTELTEKDGLFALLMKRQT